MVRYWAVTNSKTDDRRSVLALNTFSFSSDTATLAVSDDHLIVAQQISREPNDNGLLVAMVDTVQRECGEHPRKVSADSGFFSLQNLEVMEERGIDAYVPDSNMACVLHHGEIRKQPKRHPALLRMRSKSASMTGRALYRRRKALAEPIMGVLKEQRGMRRFRMRGLRSSGGVHAGNHGVEPDADVAAQPVRETFRVEQNPHKRPRNVAR